MKKLVSITTAIVIFITASLVSVNAASSADMTGSVQGDTQVITDIKNWKHPVKAVLAYNRIELLKVVLLKSRTYPIFYTKLPSNLNVESKLYYNRVMREIARANGYWNYSLTDESRKITVDVFCNKDSRRINIIVVNNKDYYYNELFNTKASSGQKTETAYIYLEKQVPEIEEYCKRIDNYNKQHVKEIGYEIHVIFRLDSSPDPENKDKYLRDYYHIYIGEAHPDHTSRWQTFLVRADLKEILVDNTVSGRYISLEEWRRKRQ